MLCVRDIGDALFVLNWYCDVVKMSHRSFFFVFDLNFHKIKIKIKIMISKQKYNLLKFFVTCFWMWLLYLCLSMYTNWSMLDEGTKSRRCFGLSILMFYASLVLAVMWV